MGYLDGSVNVADPVMLSVYNATADLLMMAAWNCALDTIQGEPIPVSTISASPSQC